MRSVPAKGPPQGIDFLVIGHITHDLVSGGAAERPATADNGTACEESSAPLSPLAGRAATSGAGGFRLGGTVSYAAVTARRLGRHPAILTRGSLEGLDYTSVPGMPSDVVRLRGDDLDGIVVHMLPDRVVTTFTNIYRDGRRTQVVRSVAGPIEPERLLQAWADVPLVLLGPLTQELPITWASTFPNAVVGVTPQGWMRGWDAEGHVGPIRWQNAEPFLRRADVIVLSREDVGNDDDYIAELAARVRRLVVTDGWHGALVYEQGQVHFLPARQTHEVDPTGAGDIFATALLVRLAETDNVLAAARFAHVVASMSVESQGMASIPTRQEVEAWLERNP